MSEVDHQVLPTLFMFVASPAQIAEVRHDIELQHGCRVAVVSVYRHHGRQRSGDNPYTQVTWARVA